MPFYAIDNIRPVVHPDSYVHPTATLVGDVIIGAGCYIGPSASLRGDFGRLILKEGVNLQDTCVMHGFPGKDSIVHKHGHIGHGAILHGCIIGENALVGMNAVVMDGAVVGESAIVAAMSFVKAAFVVPDRHLVAGIPCKIIKELSEEDVEWKRTGTRDYQELAIRSMQGMVETTPLTEEEVGRQRINVACSVPLYETRKDKPK